MCEMLKSGGREKQTPFKFNALRKVFCMTFTYCAGYKTFSTVANVYLIINMFPRDPF